jgi:hypothetical protein
MELEIRLNFVKTSEFRGGVVKPKTPLGKPLVLAALITKKVFPAPHDYEVGWTPKRPESFGEKNNYLLLFENQTKIFWSSKPIV